MGLHSNVAIREPYCSVAKCLSFDTAVCGDSPQKKPLLVRGGGAGLIVELPYPLTGDWPSDVSGRLERISRGYPPGRFTAKLVDVGGTSISISNRPGGVAKDTFQFLLTPEAGYKRGSEFKKVTVCAVPAVDTAHVLRCQIGEWTSLRLRRPSQLPSVVAEVKSLSGGGDERAIQDLIMRCTWICKFVARFDNAWDKKRSAAVRLMGVLLREDDSTLERRVCESDKSTKTHADAAAWMQRESVYLRRVAPLLETAGDRVAFVVKRCRSIDHPVQEGQAAVNAELERVG